MKKTALQEKLLVLFLAIGVAFTSLPLSGLVASADDTAALPKIWLDAGHGGSDPGAMNGDRHEADDNLRVTLAVGAKLEAAGFDVGYSRTTDVYVDLGDRVPMAKRYGADFVISFHRNSADNPAATGLETYYHFKETTGSTTYKLANTLQINIQAITGWANRGTKADGDPSAGDTGLRITRNSWENGIAGALIELGFISNDSDNAIYDEKFDEMVTGLATAISETAGGQEISDAIKPYEKNGELYLTDCDSLTGWWTAPDTEINLEPSDIGDGNVIHMKNPTSYKDHPAAVGAMAFLDFDHGYQADLSKYNKLRFYLWSSIDYANDIDRRYLDVFQVNLVTRTEAGHGIEQDGYNIPILGAYIQKGWNDFVITLDEGYRVVNTADKTKIHRLRFSWFNNSNGDNVEFKIDNVRCYYADDVKSLCSCKKDTEDVFDFCGNEHSAENDILTVNGQTVTDSYPGKDSVINSFYARVGKNYGDTDYTRSFNYTKYYSQFEMMVLSEKENTIFVSHGNEKNNMEWQFPSSVNVTAGKWQRAEIKMSDIGANALLGDCKYGLDNVNLLHFAQAEKGVLQIKNMVLVTEEYANERSAAEQAFFEAVEAIVGVTGRSYDIIEYAKACRITVSQFVNFRTAKFEAFSKSLDDAIAEYEDLTSAAKGDVDLDGEITVSDALLALQTVVGSRTLTQKAFYTADIGNKGQVTITDALLILQTSVGMLTKEDLENYDPYAQPIE